MVLYKKYRSIIVRYFFYVVVDDGVGVLVNVGVGVIQGQSTNTTFIFVPLGTVQDFIVMVEFPFILLVWGTPSLQLVVVNVFAVNNRLVTSYSQHTEGVDDGVTVGVGVGVVVGVGEGIGKQELQSIP